MRSIAYLSCNGTISRKKCAMTVPLHALNPVASFSTSGFILKDTIQVEALDDQDVDGASIYITNYSRSLGEKLSKHPFSDPSQASLTCTGVATIQVGADVGGTDGKEVYAERKTLNFLQNKTLRIRRIVDQKRKNVIYIAYSTLLTSSKDEEGESTSRYRTSICVVPLAAAAPALVDQ